jgi:anti-sigma B factor antagonist
MPVHFKAPACLDAAHVADLRSEFERLATCADDVVVDMTRTETLDGSGVGAMVYAFKRLAVKGRRLTIRNVSGQPLSLLHSAGLLSTLSAEKRERRMFAALRDLPLARLLTGTAPARPAGAAFGTKATVRETTGEQRTKGVA